MGVHRWTCRLPCRLIIDNRGGKPVSDAEIWRSKTQELGGKIAALLATDVDVFFRREVRERFVGAPDYADGLDDAAVARLKHDTAAAAAEAAAWVREALGEAAWVAVEPPADLEAPVTAHAPVASVLAQVEARLTAFLDGRSIPGDAPRYGLPARFIDGENLVTLTRNLWKAARHLAAARDQVRVTAEHTAVSQRRQRWDEA
jgi:hypothetical protein